jgi:hypothetical protein
LRQRAGQGIPLWGIFLGGMILRIPEWASWKSKREGLGTGRGVDKRHALRLPVAMHVSIYGRVGREPFSENAETINVCTLGGLVAIATPVRYSQRLILTNLQTNEELACRVARLTRAEDGRRLVGLAFLQPGPRFWRSGPTASSLHR